MKDHTLHTKAYIAVKLLAYLFPTLCVTNLNLDFRSITSFRGFTQFAQANYSKTGRERFLSFPLKFVFQYAPLDATKSMELRSVTT